MEDKNCYAAIAGYSLEYRNLKLKLKKEFPYVYKLGILIAISKELEKGFMAKSIRKATNSGTKINYEAILKEETLKKYYIELNTKLLKLQQEDAIKEIIKFSENDYKKNISNRWTEEELKYLKNNYGKLGAELVAENLNRKVNAVRKKASRLKITRIYKKDI